MTTLAKGTHAPAILAALQANPNGLTDGEIAAAIGVTSHVANYHRRKLQKAGRVTYCGSRQVPGVNTPPTVWRCANG
jgi:predicted transcriptional regulator